MRLINADKLREDVIDLPDPYNGFSDTYDKEMIIDLVDEQPTVDSVKYGHWVRNDNSTYLCSECQARIPNKQHLIEIVRWGMIFGATQLFFWVMLVLFN